MSLMCWQVNAGGLSESDKRTEEELYTKLKEQNRRMIVEAGDRWAFFYLCLFYLCLYYLHISYLHCLQLRLSDYS